MIRLVVTDVDGTLVQPDKSLADSTVAAARRLQEAGVQLAVVSARPPRGIRPLADRLGGTLVAGFNGGAIQDEHGTVLEQRLLPEPAARTAMELFAARGVAIWAFPDDEWLLTDPSAPYIDLERHTIGFGERVVDDLAPYAARSGKLVGVSADFALLARVEAELQAALAGGAAAHRSQQYYLDVTHPDANKGYAVRALAAHLGVDLADVAVLGDMPNDLPMFDVAGLAIAMGQSGPEVKARAGAVTDANDADGWAHAVDRILLPAAR